MTSAGSQRHRFRFFVDAAGAPAARVALRPQDARHAAVLRLTSTDVVEVVDDAGVLWRARVEDGSAVLDASLGALREPGIELVAGALVGGRFDDLVDAAVQAGATRVVPFAAQRRDAERLRERRPRLQRIAAAAAKQAKRGAVPDVADPIDAETLLALDPGVVLDPVAAQLLDDAVAHAPPQPPLRLLVGPADGLDPAFVAQLVERGWQRGRLGPSILRSELAAPVAVAIAAMHAPRDGGTRTGV